MASRSSCHAIKHDVFISFRGTDVRKGLLSHLRKELRRRQIDVYVDERLERGDEILPSLLRAIEESQISLIIFSKDYASSKCCLEELAKIIDCKQTNKQIVLSVFFNVDPSDVRNQQGDYGDAFAQHEEKLKDNGKVQRWRSALRKAGRLSGFHYPTNFEDESDLIDKIVEDIAEKLSKFYPSETYGLVAIDQHIEKIQSLLMRESNEVMLVGLWGMGGIGKTTIARAIFDKYSPQYDGCCFLNVREELEQHGLMSLLREKLITELLEGEGLHSSGISKSRFFNSAGRRMARKKVLVVLDDATTSEHIKYLVGESICFGRGSRVIITSRDSHVLTSGGVHQIHEVKEMNTRDSFKLFCLNAFNKSQPNMGYEKLTEEVVKIAQGNPLALKVLGSDFHSRSIETWECALSKINKYPNEKIQSVLRFSYEGLHEVEKKTFLDIALIFIGEDKDYVISQLDAWGFHGASGIEVLQKKALITISNDNRIQMHDLIRQMGCEIVRQESIKYPGRRSRLWDSEEVYDVLRHNLGTDEVEAMKIDLSQFTDLPLRVDTLKNMPGLRFLKLYYPLHIELSMPPSRVKAMLLEMVDSKKMKLDRSNNTMVELPQFSMTTNLKCADLKICDGAQGLVKLCCTDISRSEHVLECESMCDGHAPIFSLQKQVSLLLSGCQELMSSASEIHIKCHYYFLIDGCSGPKEFSITLKETRQLNITRPGMEILDSSIGNLSNLKDSDVDGQQLKDLPNDLLCLRSTYYLKLSKNKGQSTGKTKIHILCDGLRYYQRISFRMLYNSLLFVPSNLSVVPWCRELTMEEWRAMLLLEARPFVPKMALRVLHPKASLMIVNRYEYVVCEIGSYLTIRDGKKVCASRYPRIKFTIGYKTDISNGYLVLTGAGVLTINLFMGRIRVSRYSC